MPLPGEKKLIGLLFTSTEYFMVEKLYLIHLIHLSPNPICLWIETRKDQLNLTNAFSISSLKSSPGVPLFCFQSSSSLAISVASGRFAFPEQKHSENHRLDSRSASLSFLRALWPMYTTNKTDRPKILKFYRTFLFGQVQ